MKKNLISILLCSSAMIGMAHDYTTPDFAFPQKVMADAETRYQEAVKKGDGEALVDALIRWGLAKSSISVDYKDTILARIDTVRAHETRTDIRCLLNILGKQIAQSRERDGYALDYSEVDSLWQYPVANYANIIRAEKIDLMRIPTLADFLWYQDIRHAPLRTSDEELLPYLFQQRLDRKTNTELMALYHQYENRVESGEILNATERTDSLLTLYKAYVKRWPKSPWLNNIKNKISEMEAKQIALFYPLQIHSGDSIPVTIDNIQNLKYYTLKVYAVPDAYYKASERKMELSVSQLKLVSSSEIKHAAETTAPSTLHLSPLPYGRYVIRVELTDDFGRLQKSTLERQNVMVVSDRTQMKVNLNGKLQCYWIDINDGHPITTPAEGDLYADSTYIMPYRYGQNSDPQTAYPYGEIFTDLNIYRPGETIRWTAICYDNDFTRRKPSAMRKVTLSLCDPFGKNIATHTVQTDSMGQCAGKFEIPSDLANGRFQLNLGYTTSAYSFAYKSIQVSEYKIPTFLLEMQCDKQRYHTGDTLHLFGHAATYNDVTMAGYQVKFTQPIDTTLITDQEGNFSWEYIVQDDYNTKFHAQLTDEAGETQSAQVMCYRNWIEPQSEKEPEMEVKDLGPDQQHQAQIEIDTPWPAHIYYIICTRDSLLHHGWLHYTEAGKHIFRHPFPTQMDDGLSMRFITMHQSQYSDRSITVQDSLLQHSVHIALETFRDRLFPGSQERWTFRLTDAQGKPVQGGRMLLELYQQALEEIASNPWNWEVPLCWRSLFSVRYSNLSTTWTHLFWQRPYLNPLNGSKADLYLYGNYFFNIYGNSGLKGRIAGYSKNSMRKAAVSLESMESMYDYAVMEEEEIPSVLFCKKEGNGKVEKNATDTDVTKAFANVKVREMLTKVALWKPMLTSDANGQIAITVEMPDDNTTWRMQALAFTQHLATDAMSRKIVTQRPVMVQPSLPRFLRHGDKTELKAMVQNTQDCALTADVLVELFNPRTGEILASELKSVALAANSQQAVGIECSPSISLMPLPYLGFRIKAKAEGCSDGEQQMLPLLEATQPVTETQPFYLEPGEQELILSLPSSPFSRSSSLFTLELCSNPAWYAIMALPTLCNQTNSTTTQLAHHLYGLTLAEGIANASVKGMNPEQAGLIRQTICNWGKNKDSVLVSPLLQNADLKIGTLKASPWLNAAEQQTLRMQMLQKLFDAKHTADQKDQLHKQLSALQNRDGGLSWIDYIGRESSLMATGEVLELLGEMHHLGLYTGWIGEEAALAYYDSMQMVRLQELETMVREKSIRKIDYGQFADYLYVRSMFDAPLPRKNQQLLDKAAHAAEQDWREWSLPMRAYLALALHRNGKIQPAKILVESLREFAYHDGNRGIYWDMLAGSYGRCHKTSLNALILQALHEVAPGQEEDGVRRWLLLNKQSNDWGNASMAAQVIHTLLSTGSDWLSGSELQYTRRELTLEELRSGKVAIPSAPSNPVWGALYIQREAPMESIEAYSIEDLKISKQIIGANCVGSLATIRIEIDTRRDLEYVTIKDERPANLEPANHFSGYNWHSGAYQETKDSETNFFVHYLPKGHHVLTYQAYVKQAGTFVAGAATIQCQYAPQLTAHSAGNIISSAPQW